MQLDIFPELNLDIDDWLELLLYVSPKMKVEHILINFQISLPLVELFIRAILDFFIELCDLLLTR